MNVGWWVVQGGEEISPCCPLPHLFVSKKYILLACALLRFFGKCTTPTQGPQIFLQKNQQKEQKEKQKKLGFLKILSYL
jgi:hypothetical protein